MRFQLTIALSAISAVATAQAYSVTHNFNISVNPSTGQQFQAQWFWGLQTIAKNRTGSNDTKYDYNNALFTNGGSGLRQLSSSVGGAFATSNAQFSLSSNGAGFHKAWGNSGFTNPNGRDAISYANSVLKARIGTYNVQGGMQWSPTWQTDGISGSRRNVRDPLTVSVRDLVTNTRRTEELLDIQLEEDGPGTSFFADGRLILNSENAYFRVAMESPVLTGQQGVMQFRVVGGMVVESMGVGYWQGVNPQIGTQGPLAIQVTSPTGFNLQYDFGMGPGEYETEFEMDGGGASAVPEPSGLLMLIGGIGALALRKRVQR